MHRDSYPLKYPVLDAKIINPSFVHSWEMELDRKLVFDDLNGIEIDLRAQCWSHGTLQIKSMRGQKKTDSKCK